jgi:putative transposase
MRQIVAGMSRYLRPSVPGASVFFTVVLADCGSDLMVNQVEALRAAVQATRADRQFRVDAWVVLPDHMHCVGTLPEGDADFSTRMGAIKGRFSRAVPEGRVRTSHVLRRERGIWQRRFWEHHVRSDEDFAACGRYCWINPVRHGLVANPKDWPYSSWHRDGGDLP